jgi:putative Mg2+ transporter-C (MgtC) family protein
LTPDLLKQTLGVRTGQIKRFLATPRDGIEEITVVLSKVSSHDINSYVTKLNELDGVNTAKVIDRKRGEQS